MVSTCLRDYKAFLNTPGNLLLILLHSLLNTSVPGRVTYVNVLEMLLMELVTSMLLFLLLVQYGAQTVYSVILIGVEGKNASVEKTMNLLISTMVFFLLITK